MNRLFIMSESSAHQKAPVNEETGRKLLGKIRKLHMRKDLSLGYLKILTSLQ